MPVRKTEFSTKKIKVMIKGHTIWFFAGADKGGERATFCTVLSVLVG